MRSQSPIAKGSDEFDIVGLRKRIKGRIVDHTANHGRDNRIWSLRPLHQWRDLYIYLPPGYNHDEAYPIIIYLHGFSLDERTFLRIVPYIDAAICKGKLPPVIVVAPDGSLDGQGCLEKPGSFFLNSNAGPYEDFVLQDVWDFVCSRYPIRPERNAHVLAGVSMGGFAAFNIGIRHREAFGIVAGIHPPLNLRWTDVDGNCLRPSSIRALGLAPGFDNPHEVIANYGGALKVRMGPVLKPVFGSRRRSPLVAVSANIAPIELVPNRAAQRYCGVVDVRRLRRPR